MTQDNQMNIPSFSERVIDESTYFFCVPTIGQIVEGHCLIFSKREVINLSILSFDEKKDLQLFLEKIKAKLITAYATNDILIFEQGAFQPKSNVACGVDHAHLHILPFTTSLVIQEFLDEKKVISYYSNFCDCISKIYFHQKPYLLLGSAELGFWIFDYEKRRESQIVRKKIAKLNNSSEWDWKQMDEHTLMWSTYNKIIYL